MHRPEVLVLQDNPAEAALAESALLYAGAEVAGSPERAVVAVLGRKALKRYPGKLGIPAVAILHEPTEEERHAALQRGVRAVYERPDTWKSYRALIQRALAEWLPTRKD